MSHRSVVVVVGAGLAGLTSAIEAHRSGARVVVLEKTASVGGNSAKATSGMNGAGTRFQAAAHIDDSVDAFRGDTMRSGDQLSQPHLVEMLVTHSAAAVEWVASFGVDLSSLVQCGGHGVARTHREPPRADGKPAPVGWDIIASLKRHVATLPPDEVQVITDANVRELLLEKAPAVPGNRVGVRGVVYMQAGETKEVLADAVILATGGFGFHAGQVGSLIHEHAPRYRRLPTTNGAFAVGDGVRIAVNAGAALVDMDKVQVHPTSFVDPSDPANGVKFLAPEALRGCGAVLVNREGKRFADELGRRDYLTNAIFDQSPQGHAADELEPVAVMMVLNDAVADMFGRASFDFYAKVKKFAVEVAGYDGLASHLGASADAVRGTFEAYNKAATGEIVDAFGKKTFPVRFEAAQKLYACTITPAIHYCMGGVRINAATEVLAEDAPSQILLPAQTARRYQIPNLYGVGEVTGGVHGGNRLAGNSLLECVVFGRIAGRRAASTFLAREHPYALVNDAWAPLTLRQKQNVGGATWIFSFNLPSPLQHTGLQLGEYIAVRAVLAGEEVVRYYSPISRPNDLGVIELLIKCEDTGLMSVHLAKMQPGETLEFKGPMGGLNLSFQTHKRVAMLAGGVGISPMIQILRAAFHEAREHGASGDVELTLLYGAVEEKELVFADILREKEQQYPNFHAHFLLNKPPPNWTGRVGFINEGTIKQLCPPPGPDVKIILCGPGAMCRALKPVLLQLYPPENVFSFM